MMGKSCGQHEFLSLGGQYYSLGQTIEDGEGHFALYSDLICLSFWIFTAFQPIHSGNLTL